jgi:hypothetical protein
VLNKTRFHSLGKAKQSQFPAYTEGHQFCIEYSFNCITLHYVNTLMPLISKQPVSILTHIWPKTKLHITHTQRGGKASPHRLLNLKLDVYSGDVAASILAKSAQFTSLVMGWLVLSVAVQQTSHSNYFLKMFNFNLTSFVLGMQLSSRVLVWQAQGSGLNLQQHTNRESVCARQNLELFP